MKRKEIWECDMKGSVENCPAIRVTRVNAMGITKGEFPDKEQQKSSCMKAVQ